jgi:EmrB/QacA subfamily drug resistance transporter
VSATSAAATLSPAGRWIAFIVLLAGGFMPPVDFFIVNVSLPSIQSSLGASPAELQLVVSGYASAYAVFLITGGRLGDLYGRRRLFLFGMAGFTAANLLCGLAASPTALVVGRIVQGVAAAIIVPQVLGPVRTLFPTERELARALSSYGIMMGLAAVCGQFLGGALVEWSPFGLGWRAVFLLKVPVALAVLLAAWAVVPETSTSQRVRIDWVGAALLSLALACLVLPLSEGRQQGWPAWTFVMLAAVLPLIVVFLRFEARLTARGAMPLLDLQLMAISSFRRGVVVGTLFFFTTAFYLTFSLYQQQGLGTDPLHTGLAILPYGAGLFIGPLASGPLVARLRHGLLPIGMGIQVAGYGATGLAIWSGHDGWPVFVAVLVAGFGQGIALPRLYNAALGDVPPAQAGVAAAVINSALQIGGAVSVAAIGSLFFTVLGRNAGHAAYANAFGTAQAATTLALFASMLLSISSRGRRPATPAAAGRP